MDNFYKLTFTNSEGITRVEHYIDKYPKDWFRIDGHVNVPFIYTGEDTIATCSIVDYVNRIVCDGLCHNGDMSPCFADSIAIELGNLEKIGDFCQFHVNDGWFQAEVVERPEINVKKTIEDNSLTPSQMRYVYVNGKHLLEDGKRYDGMWFSSEPWEEQACALLRAVKRLYPEIISISSYHEDEDLEVTIVAKTPKAIEDVLKDVFGCDIGDGIHDYVCYGNDDTIERVKYTAVFTNF